MSKSLRKVAARASLLALTVAMIGSHSHASPITNMENPLFIPGAGQFAVRASAGVMYKRTDRADALVVRGLDGANEWPIPRFNGEINFGITDRLSAYGQFGWTQNDSIGRKGMHNGRVGLNYRVLNGAWTDGWIWDLYADAHLGGLSPMQGTFTLIPPASGSFKYDNYSNGRWGAHVGTRVGRSWNNFTVATFAEVQQTFGNRNNRINLAIDGVPGTVGDMSVMLASTRQLNAGFQTLYQLSHDWSIGGGFTYRYWASNGVRGLANLNVDPSLPPPVAGMIAGAIDPLLTALYDMEDGLQEYILHLIVANQITDRMQIAFYFDYTLDDSRSQSQNGTDRKFEFGLRANITF